MKDFIQKYADELGEMAALHFLKHKLCAIHEEFDEDKEIETSLKEFHEILEDFMKAKGIKV